MNGRLKEAALSNHVGAPPATAATPEPDVGPLLIEAGQATIPDHIGRKDGRNRRSTRLSVTNGLP